LEHTKGFFSGTVDLGVSQPLAWMKGTPAALITAGILAMAFMGFAGLV